jgi:4-amino-4-deoxy-L-arabinose transferase-like glycosyltransferase
MFTASIVVSLIGALGVFFIYLLGKEIYNETTGILAALFIGFSPFIVMASHWIMTDIPVLTFITIAFYLLILASKKQNNFLYLLSGLFFTISILTRFTALILIFVIPVYMFINRIKIKQMFYFIVGFLVSLLPYLIWAQSKYGFFLAPFINARRAVSDQVGSIFFYLKHFFEVYPLIVFIGILIYFGFLIFKFMSNKKIRLNKNDIVFIIWGIIFFCYISIMPHKEPRYILLLTIPLYLLSSRGYDLIFKYKRIKILLISVTILLVIFSFAGAFSKIGPISKERISFINRRITDEVAVSRYLVSLNKTVNLIYSNQNYPVYAYYTGMDVEVLINQDRHFYNVFPNNMKKEGFFIYYKSVKKEPNKKWLDSNKKFIRLKEIGDVIVYDYKPISQQ